MRVDPQTLETLIKLQSIGLIQLPELTVPAIDQRLVEWTYADFVKHMVAVQGLKAKTKQGRDSTALCRRRYIKMLESDPVVPVLLRPPTEASWIEWVAYKREEEDIAGTALNQYRKALKSLFWFLDVRPWRCLDQAYGETPAYWTLPPDDVVPRFWAEAGADLDPYTRALVQHIYHYGFHVGPRPPSEIAALRLRDVDYQGRRITGTEIKKNGRRLEVVDVEPFVLDGSSSKSLKNWHDHWRHQDDHSADGAFFLDRAGRPWSPIKLGTLLAEEGRKIWPEFVPYTMRRWAITQYLIETSDIYATADRFGITVATVERHYVDRARVREARRGRYRVKRLTRRSSGSGGDETTSKSRTPHSGVA